MSTPVDNVWISEHRGWKLVEKRDCRCPGDRHILWLSRRGSQQHQRLHQWSGGGSFGTFPCPADIGKRLGLKVPLQSSNDFGGLVIGPMTRFGGRSGEGPELPVASVTQPGDDVAALVEMRIHGGN